MKVTEKQLESTVRSRFGGIAEDLHACSRPAIGYHPDADGIMSLVMFIKVFAREKQTLLLSIDTPDRSLTVRQMKDILTFNPEVVVLIDVAPRNLKQLKELADEFMVVVLDHHQYGPEVKNVTKYLLNPHVLCSGSCVENYSCLKLLYDLCNRFSLNWLGAVGLCGDNREKYWPHFMGNFGKQKLQAITEMAEMVNLIGTTYRIDGSETADDVESRRKELILQVSEAQSVGQFNRLFRNGDLCGLYDLLEADLRDILIDIKGSLNRTCLQFIEVIASSKFSLIDGVLKDISGSGLEIKKGNTVVLYERGADLVEYRGITANRKINCGELFHGIGGGHRKMGGGASDKDPRKIMKFLKKRVAEQLTTNTG